MSRRMKIRPARRKTAPIGQNAMLMPANVCTGGRPFSCITIGTTIPSRFDLCDGRITAACG